jgi:hypothetical protein
VLRWLLASVVLAFGSIVFACSEDPIPQPCRDIPEHGCPVQFEACEDPTCQAIYACRENNVWERVKECPSYDPDAGHLPDAAPSTIVDAAPDAPPGAYGGPGCRLLEDPDCALGLALACTSAEGHSSCCGCEDLFVCTNGAWELWGSCSDAGVRQDSR